MDTNFELRPLFVVLSWLLFEQAVAGEVRYHGHVGMSTEVKFNAYFEDTLALFGRYLQLLLALYFADPVSELEQLLV